MNHDQQLADIREMRSLMERSSRFLSLSGLSGVFAGIYALIGAWMAHELITGFGRTDSYSRMTGFDAYDNLILKLFAIAVSVLVLSLITGFYFSWRKARREGLEIWDTSARRMLLNLMIPLAAGGIFCISLIIHGGYFLVAPITLLFYGLALLNCSKYSLDELRYLGLSEIVLGLIASFYPGYGLFFWAGGFGILHIVYGALMYIRHERN